VQSCVESRRTARDDVPRLERLEVRDHADELHWLEDHVRHGLQEEQGQSVRVYSRIAFVRRCDAVAMLLWYWGGVVVVL
jgi:adenylylsulfate kinase-like enzyme